MVAAINPADTQLSTLNDSTAYDPFGKEATSTGSTGRLGFQGDWTDPDTGEVDMAARWYQPGTGTFTSRDSVNYTPATRSWPTATPTGWRPAGLRRPGRPPAALDEACRERA